MFCIRRMREEDLAAVADLEKEIFTDPWSENAIRESMQQAQTLLLSALEDGVLVGYLIVYYVLEDGEIARIAVESDSRRKGVASRLLKELAFICADNGVNKLLLDVRESNESAKAFYEKKGFVLDGVRKNYYTNPTEDAILMSLELV